MPLDRAQSLCRRFGLHVPVLLAPMAGACPPALSVAVAVASAAGLGACGPLLMSPDDITAWARTVRAGTNSGFQMNRWIPDPPPHRDPNHEARIRAFLGQWGPAVPADAAEPPPLDFAAQCEAILAASPPVLSSIMGLYAPDFVARLKACGIAWFATIITVAEAQAAEAAGADIVLSQGAEAGSPPRTMPAPQPRRMRRHPRHTLCRGTNGCNARRRPPVMAT